MPRHHRHMSDLCSYDSSSSEELYARIPRPRQTRHGSIVSSHQHHHVHEPAFAGSSLAVPVIDVGSRKRAASASGLPQPNIIINADGGSRSRSRERNRPPRSRSRGRRYEDDDELYEEIIARRGRVSRSPSPYQRVDYETRKALEKLKILEEEKAEEEAQKRYKTEMDARRIKEQMERVEAEKKRIDQAKKAVEDWQREEEARKLKEKKAKEELDKRVEEELRGKLARAGYSSTEIEIMVNQAEDNERKYVNEMRIDRLPRPTYIKVNKKYLLPETLNAFELPWAYDLKDSDYILIKECVSEEFQEELFAHTRKIKSRKLIAGPIQKETILKINGKGKDKMYLVRKKDTSPARFGLIRY